MAGLEHNAHFHHYFLLLNMILYGLKHPFCEFKLAFPVVIPPNPHPHSLWSQWKEKESLDALQALLNHSQNTDMASTLFQPQIQNKAPYEESLFNPNTPILFRLLRWEL